MSGLPAPGATHPRHPGEGRDLSAKATALFTRGDPGIRRDDAGAYFASDFANGFHAPPGTADETGLS